MTDMNSSKLMSFRGVLKFAIADEVLQDIQIDCDGF